MSSYTKGPWLQVGTTVYALEQHGYNRGKPDFRNRFDAQVQGAFCPQEEKEATARLIAAAPELLEALVLARRALAWASEQRPEFEAEYDLADHAIAKATGESA